MTAEPHAASSAAAPPHTVPLRGTTLFHGRVHRLGGTGGPVPGRARPVC
ncbi:hypothetical protein [Streptomyces dubilierae]|uniref:Uncharacterized protein n=1 Tax=Streptomyces dubilierae TaxID=3075533 RepID=A0ABU2P795_9ACTN|nr:hypothetical protein [Streptomyces sp. DSM 41921]MDT0388028.1 hypothetical protein [Streptomyces sp. DSM 41921]